MAISCGYIWVPAFIDVATQSGARLWDLTKGLRYLNLIWGLPLKVIKVTTCVRRSLCNVQSLWGNANFYSVLLV